jgi:hypothetical protein
MTRISLAVLLIIMLAACNGGYIPLNVATPVVWPSPLPVILTPTPYLFPFPTSTTVIQTATPTYTLTSTLTSTGTPTATFTPTFTSSFTPSSTFTSTPSSTSTFTNTPTFTSTPTNFATQETGLNLDILGCNTSLDISHLMGEVTNAYPVIGNATGKNLTNVCATLSATDEARVHPDKTECISFLPSGYEVTLKLTVDTATGQDTAIKVVVTTHEGLGVSAARPSCVDIGLPGWLPEMVGVLHPTP